MAIGTLMEHLKISKKPFSVLTESATLEDITIKDYKLSPQSMLILTDQGHEIHVDLKDFSYIDFDVIVNRATNNIEMIHCFNLLYNCGNYNAYFRRKDQSTIIAFCHVPDEIYL